jgi:cellulose synthase/poly-beta-1,6-N-acetylglucosamine synthase-like glycosyltransferase
MIWTIIAVALFPFAILFVLPLVSDACSLLRLGWSRVRVKPVTKVPVPRQRLLVLVPAHNEQLLVADAVRSMVAMSRNDCDFELVLIADNCTDETAAIATANGARVLERFDTVDRGKPHALDWAMRQFRLEHYDAVVIVDADTVVDPDFADAFARRGPLRGKAVQSYSAISNEGDSWLTALGGLLVSMRYDFQYALKQRVGLSCPIGNGWCVGTDLLANAGWAPDSLTETWELYARYTAYGAPVDFAADSVMRGQEAHTLAQGATQRKRWQAGKLAVFRDYWWSILTSPAIGAHQKLDAIAELAAPGPVLHATLVTPIALVMGSAPSPAARIVGALFGASLIPVLGWALVTLYRYPQRARALRALAHIPLYAVWRVAVGVQAFAIARRRVWHRSPRHVSA